MGVIEAPDKYENKIRIADAGELIAKVGRNALILAGSRAYEAAGKPLEETLTSSGISFRTEILAGYPTLSRAQALGERIKAEGYDLVIAVGGGRIMDQSKAAADFGGVPIVTIPTIAATCAAWSVLSVLYTEEGAQDTYLYTKESPKLIIVDKELILAAPERYLISGVTDAIAKWYEIRSNFNGNEYDLELRLQIKVSELILELLEKEFLDAASAGTDRIPYQIKSNAVDANIFLAGLTGSILGNVPYGGLAHPFYNRATHLKATHVRLHGEIVSFGTEVQLLIEGRSEDEIKQRAVKLKAVGAPVTLEELGITEDVEGSVRFIAKGILERVGDYASAEVKLSEDTLTQAIFKADEIGRSLCSH